MSRIRIEHGNLIVPNGVLPNTDLWIADRILAGIGERGEAEADWDRLDATGFFVSPGFVDVHVHGGAGADFMGGSPDDAIAIARYHAQGGTTTLLATTATDSAQSILTTIRAVTEAMRAEHHGARILGVHLEGPYFNLEKKGCHLAQYVRNPEPEEYERFLEYDAVRWMTLAPELPGAERLIRALSERGILASAGHSNATYRQIASATEWGLRHTTHLYCAMSSVIKSGPARSGGVIEASLLLDDLTTELIADGRHLPPELMRLAVKCKGTERVVLVTDAQRAAGMPDGSYEFGRKGYGAPFVVQNGVATTPDFTGYASSTVQMIVTVRVACEQIGVPIHEAVNMASRTPARILGMDRAIGSLEVGKRADVVLFDDRWRVRATFVEGRKVYCCD